MIPLLALIKPRYHLSFVTVAVAALLFADPVDITVAEKLWWLYISFNVLLYGGIYTFNDIADRQEDAHQAVKRLRPIPAGRLSVARAAVLATGFCAAGMLAAVFWLPVPVLGCYAANARPRRDSARRIGRA